MTLVKVTGTSFIRDTESMALMNTDENAKNDYYNKARLAQAQKREINNVKSEIDELKNDVSEIKQLLLQLISKD
jgi:hypothetical protein